MGQNPGQIRKALDVRLWTTEYPPSALPTGPGDHSWLPENHGWHDLGRTSLGTPPSQSYEQDVSAVRSHQAFFPDREDVTSVSSALTFVLLQTNARSLFVAFGGGTTTVGDGGTLWEPPDPDEILNQPFILDVRDGSFRQLNVFPRTRPSMSGAISFPREGDTPTQYEISATVLNPDTGKPFYKITTGDLTAEDGGS